MSPDELGPARITQTRDTLNIRGCGGAGLVRAQFLRIFSIFLHFSHIVSGSSGLLSLTF